MLRPFLILLLTLFTGKVVAQELIPFDFTSEEENKLLRENDSVKFYVATTDTANTVALNEEGLYYKLLNKDRKVIAEGVYILEGEKYLQDGKWVEKFDNGKIKNTGSYHRNLPVGTWQEYYNTGKLKTICNYAIVIYKGDPRYSLSGSFQEYYPGGKLKTTGFYSSVLSSYKDTVEIDDPVSNKKVSKIVTHNELKPEKTAHWEYYNEAGELDRKEDL